MFNNIQPRTQGLITATRHAPHAHCEKTLVLVTVSAGYVAPRIWVLTKHYKGTDPRVLFALHQSIQPCTHKLQLHCVTSICS